MQAERQTSSHRGPARAAAAKRDLQESKYAFPYHHIPQWGNGVFLHYRVMAPAYEYASYCRYILDRLADLRFSRMLDVGCGDGRLVCEAHKRFPDARVVGVDICDRAIAFARAFSPDCEFVVGNIRDPEVLDSRFDVATLIEVLEHIPPDAAEAFLRAIADRLCDDGRLILTVPTSNVAVPGQHFRHFDDASVRSLLESRFHVRETVYLNRKSAWETLFYRVMSNRLYVLAMPALLRRMLRLYERYFLCAAPHNARRLLVICAKKSNPRRDGGADGSGRDAEPVTGD